MAGFSIDAELKYWKMRREAVEKVLGTINKSVVIEPDREIDKGRMKGVLATITEIINRLEEYAVGRQPHIPGA